MGELCGTCLGQDFVPTDAGDVPCVDCAGGRDLAEWEAYWAGLSPAERRREQDMMSDYVTFHAELARREGRAT